MNKQILILFLSLIIFISCAEKKENKPEQKLVKEKKQTEKIQELDIDKGVVLNYGMQKGKKFKFALTSSKKTIESVKVDTMVMPQSYSENSEYIVSFTVNEQDKNGNLTLDMKCERVKAKGENSAGQKLEFDSDKLPKDTMELALFFNYQVLTSSNFFVRISKIGEVLDIYKYDKMIDKILTKYPKQPTAEQKAELRNEVKEGMLKPIVTQIFKSLSNKELKKDSSWTISFPGQLAVFDLMNTATYKLDRIYSDGNREFAEIKSSLDVKFKGKKERTEQGIRYVFTTPKTTATGMMLFDLTDKLVTKATSEIYLEMSMTAKELKKGGQSGIRTTKIETKSSIQLLE